MSYLSRLLTSWYMSTELDSDIIKFQRGDISWEGGEGRLLAEREEFVNRHIQSVQNEILTTSEVCDPILFQEMDLGSHVATEIAMESLLVRTAIALDDNNIIAMQSLMQEAENLTSKDK